MSNGEEKGKIREAVGVFLSTDDVEKAVHGLLDAGFERDAIGLLTSERHIRSSLSDLYMEPQEEGGSGEPKASFVKKGSVGDTVHAQWGSLFFVGSSAAVGAGVATAGILGGALIPAIVAAGAVTAVGAALSLVINQDDAEYLQEQVDAGHLLLFVRTPTPSAQQQALDIMSPLTAEKPRIYEAGRESGT